MDDLVAKLLATARTERATRVVSISVRLGALSHFTPGHFAEHFVDAARGTIAEGATVRARSAGEPTDALAQSVVLEEVELEFDG